MDKASSGSTHNGAPSEVILNLDGMTPAALGQMLFRRVHYCVRLAAEHYAPGRYSIEATYDPLTHERTGYELRVPDAMTAFRIRLCHDLARQCKPMPWVTC